nr:unnamed protein product [Digitaria exilis]
MPGATGCKARPNLVFGPASAMPRPTEARAPLWRTEHHTARALFELWKSQPLTSSFASTYVAPNRSPSCPAAPVPSVNLEPVASPYAAVSFLSRFPLVAPAQADRRRPLIVSTLQQRLDMGAEPGYTHGRTGTRTEGARIVLLDAAGEISSINPRGVVPGGAGPAQGVVRGQPLRRRLRFLPYFNCSGSRKLGRRRVLVAGLRRATMVVVHYRASRMAKSEMGPQQKGYSQDDLGRPPLTRVTRGKVRKAAPLQSTNGQSPSSP